MGQTGTKIYITHPDTNGVITFTVDGTMSVYNIESCGKAGAAVRKLYIQIVLMKSRSQSDNLL